MQKGIVAFLALFLVGATVKTKVCGTTLQRSNNQSLANCVTDQIPILKHKTYNDRTFQLVLEKPSSEVFICTNQARDNRNSSPEDIGFYQNSFFNGENGLEQVVLVNARRFGTKTGVWYFNTKSPKKDGSNLKFASIPAEYTLNFENGTKWTFATPGRTADKYNWFFVRDNKLFATDGNFSYTNCPNV